MTAYIVMDEGSDALQRVVDCPELLPIDLQQHDMLLLGLPF